MMALGGGGGGFPAPLRFLALGLSESWEVQEKWAVWSEENWDLTPKIKKTGIKQGKVRHVFFHDLRFKNAWEIKHSNST